MSEREVLELLRENARYSTADIARMTDLEEPEVDAVIEELESAGVVRGYRAVVTGTNSRTKRFVPKSS